MNPLIDFSKPLRTAVDLAAIQQFENARESLQRRYSEFVEKTFREAIVRHLGHMPDDETLKRHGHIFITPENVMHLAWLGDAPKIGDTMDPSTVIASVSPP